MSASATAATTQPGSKTNKSRAELARNFFIKGLVIAIISGVTYGLYSAFIAEGMTSGIWEQWYAPETVLSAFVTIYVLGMLGSGLNDMLSAIWALGITGVHGKLGDFVKCLRSKPGGVMVACAAVGGPIANGAYIVALHLAGSVAAPITALCPVIGALISRVLFKQPLNARMVVGIFICIAASFMIGSTGFEVDAPEGLLLGLLIAFIAALGWGVEGAIAGYGTALIDYEIGITIRQLTSGLLNLIVFVPVLALLAGDIGLAPSLLGAAATSWPAIAFFVVSGLFSYLSFGLWYKGNSMCGTALGMACNASYSFWAPLFCWLLLGVIMGNDGWGLAPISWVAAFVMFVGIVLVAVNPLQLIRQARGLEAIGDATPPATPSSPNASPSGMPTDNNAAATTIPPGLPFNYALLKYYAATNEADASAVMAALQPNYGTHHAYKRHVVEEAIATAEKNGIIAESRISTTPEGTQTVYYQVTLDGQSLIARFI